MTARDDTGVGLGRTGSNLKEAAGYLTGDRKVEAEGRAENEPGVDPGDDQEVSDVEDDVRADHGEVPPEGPQG